ncbi:uncharacterized protein LOC125178277 [Hyalella azteca]|uniref:Uncharacterized protein LOC125178277 n=1 Tax=Hyalella azteca TaxID=294128 RepID=A0A979FN49_HYAAZ|nr:uncharacterized protein LOC125178277 [Hyalella azteca]
MLYTMAKVGLHSLHYNNALHFSLHSGFTLLVVLLASEAASQAPPAVPFVSSCTYHTQDLADCPTFSLRALHGANDTSACYAATFSQYQEYRFYIYSRSAFHIEFEVRFNPTLRVVMTASFDDKWNGELTRWSEFMVKVDEKLGLILKLDDNLVQKVKCFASAAEELCSSFKESIGVFQMTMYLRGDDVWWTPYCNPQDEPPPLVNLHCSTAGFTALLTVCIILLAAFVGLLTFVCTKPHWQAIKNWFTENRYKCDLTLRPTILRPDTRIAIYTNDNV